MAPNRLPSTNPITDSVAVERKCRRRLSVFHIRTISPVRSLTRGMIYFGIPSAGGKYCHAISTRTAKLKLAAGNAKDAARSRHRSAAGVASADKVIAVELLDRHGGLDDVIFDVELLDLAQSFRIEAAEVGRRICPVGFGRVAPHDALDLGFLVRVLWNGRNIVTRRRSRVGYAVAHGMEHGMHNPPHRLWFLFDGFVRSKYRLRHCREDIVDGEIVERYACAFDGIGQVGYRHDGVEPAGDHELGDAGRPDRLDFEVGLLETARGEHAKQGVIAGILIGDDTDFLAAQIGEGLDVGGLARRDLEDGAASKEGHAAHLKTVWTNDHRRLTHAATKVGIADRDLFCRVSAAASGLKRDSHALGGEITALLRQLMRNEGGQHGWRREKICHRLRGKRPADEGGRGEHAACKGTSRDEHFYVSFAEADRLSVDKTVEV